MKANKYAMQTVGYFLLNFFKEGGYSGVDPMKQLDKVGYTEYHNFWKCRLPLEWYSDVLSALDLDQNDLLVEVARVKGNHAKDLHYHKISHAICIVLGPSCGFNSVPYDCAVQKDSKIETAFENMECFFPSNCNHTFYGSASDTSDKGDLYFISVQSPPLLTKDNDDFYWVYDENR